MNELRTIWKVDTGIQRDWEMGRIGVETERDETDLSEERRVFPLLQRRKKAVGIDKGLGVPSPSL